MSTGKQKKSKTLCISAWFSSLVFLEVCVSVHPNVARFVASQVRWRVIDDRFKQFDHTDVTEERFS